MANKNAKKIAITFNRDNTRELAMLNYIELKGLNNNMVIYK